MFGRSNSRRANAAGTQRQDHPAALTSTGAAGLVPTGAAGYTAGWKPLPGSQGPWQQIGAFDGQMLSQYPARVDGAQLHSGREWGCSNWYYPSISAIPNGNLQQTTRPNNVNGGQRYGSLVGAPLGPISAKKNAARLTAAQVRQSGLQAMQWAQGLSSQ